MNFGNTARQGSNLGWGGAGGTAITKASQTRGISSEFGGDNPVRMPVYNSPAQLEAARRLAGAVSSRSGRESTGLVRAPGTATYSSSFLGSIPGAAK